jgi:hypothetical protein
MPPAKKSNPGQTTLAVTDRRVGKVPAGRGGSICLACDRPIPVPADGGFAPDPCIGFIPGAVGACCGHGCPDRACVTLGGVPDRLVSEIAVPTITLRGAEALAFFSLIAQAEPGSVSIEAARWLTDMPGATSDAIPIPELDD